MATAEILSGNALPMSLSTAAGAGGAAEDIMERWRTFFKLSGTLPADKMRLQAIAKLTQIALVQYMRRREGVYDSKIFTKKRYNDLTFFMLDQKEETAAQLNAILATTCKFICNSAVKAVRFQIFHDPSKPNEVGEEVVFQYYYGNNPQAVIEFGSTGNVVLDMTDCSFDSFLRCFGEMLGRIRAYCTHLRPLPNDCEKRIRSSFCKRLPPGVEKGQFKDARGPVDYAPDMVDREIGDARLEGVAVAAILRTCYTNEEFDRVINEATAESIRNETNEIFGQGKRNEQVEVARQTQAGDTSYTNLVIDDQPVVSAATIPQRDITLQSEATQSPTFAGTTEQQLHSVEQLRSAVQSPAFDRMSIVSGEIVLPRNPQQLLNETTRHDETLNRTRDTTDSPSKNRSKSKSGDKSPNSTMEEDSMVRARKTASGKKRTNKEELEKIQAMAKKPRRQVLR